MKLVHAFAVTLLLGLGAPAMGQCMRWDAVGMAPGGFTRDLETFDMGGGAGPELFATNDYWAYRWTGTYWTGILDEFDDETTALCGYDSGTGPALYVAGYFTSLPWSGYATWHIARYSANQSVAVGGGLPTPDLNAFVKQMRVFDDGGGAKLYVAGSFTTYASISSNNIVRWNGTTWSGVGGGLPASVGALCVHDDGTGPALFASTRVPATGGGFVGELAKWNGATWTMLDAAITNNGQAGGVASMVVFDDGSGPALFAGGTFDHIGGLAANGLAKWDGTSWSALPGVPLTPAIGVLSLVVHDDGSGPSLHEASQDGVPPLLGVARWDGTNWFALGTRPAGTVYSLQSFDDGQGFGPALYVGGDFSQIGGNLPSHSVGRWYGNCAHTVDAMCFGDGTFAECPCANYGAIGAGCRNSASTAGALLSHGGTTAPDTLQLISSSEPATSTSVFLQSAALRSVQRFLGDGILCLGDPIRRMYVTSAVGGTAQAPQVGDPSVTQRSAALGDPIAPGSVRYYQVWYRDNGSYCPPAAYNISNGLRVVW